MKYPKDVYRMSIPELEDAVEQRKARFALMKIIGIPQMFFGLIYISAGVIAWKNTGQFLSFKMLFGILLMMCFAVVVGIALNLISQQKKLKIQLAQRLSRKQ